MGFLEIMEERGLIAQMTHPEELAAHLAGGSRTAYNGFDPTAPSLHVGHLMAVMGLRRWQRAGHRVIALIGGATAMVGDPSGKSEMRQMLSVEQIRANTAGLKAQLERFLDFSDPARGILVDNAAWLEPLNYLGFLREIGPHFSVNRMLTAECFRQRLEKGLSFLEFNYMLLQSYDFLHLHRAERCTMQMGGDDQWSNMLGGMELVRRLGGAQAFCLTFPLLTTSDGRKMGKTEKGAVWLDPELVPPYDYFQYWRNVDDDRVRLCLAAFTDLPMPEVDRLAKLPGSEINEAKVVLAFEATKLAHGETAASEAREAAARLFAGGGGGGGGEPEITITKEQIGGGLPIVDFIVLCQVVPSKSEARRLIQQGGLMLNGAKVETLDRVVTVPEVSGAEGLLVKKGKKHYYRIRIS